MATALYRLINRLLGDISSELLPNSCKPDLHLGAIRDLSHLAERSVLRPRTGE